MTLSTTLPAAICSSHQRIEQLPLAKAMADGSLTRSVYCQLLTQLREIHLALEEQLEAEPGLADLYQPGMARAGDIQADLEYLGAPSGYVETVPPTSAFTDKVRQEWSGRPAALAGCLYVLEGSRMGSMFLARPLARALGVSPTPGNGLDYHVRDMERRPALFKQFKAQLDALPWQDRDADELSAAAVATMEALYALYAWVGEPAEAVLTGSHS